MPGEIDERLLAGRWLHAHEQDTLDTRVFVPATTPLPPSRGRTGYDFLPDGRVVARGPGPADRATSGDGRWTLDPGGRLTIRVPGAPDELLRVESLDQDRLVVRK